MPARRKTCQKSAKVTVRLTRTAKASLRFEQGRKRGRKTVWKRYTVRSLNATTSARSYTLKRPQEGHLSRDRDRRGQGQDEELHRQVTACRLGVVALGDSITNGGGELQWGVALQSWALWVARGLGLPFTTFAVDGARAAQVAGEQVAAWRERSPADARYDLGCLYAGVNDVRVPRLGRDRLRRRLRGRLRRAGRALRPRAGRDDPARPRPPAGGRACAGGQRGHRGAATRSCSTCAASAPATS